MNLYFLLMRSWVFFFHYSCQPKLWSQLWEYLSTLKNEYCIFSYECIPGKEAVWKPCVLFVGWLGLFKAELFPEVLAGTKIPGGGGTVQEVPPSPQSDSCIKMGNCVSLTARPNWLTPCVFVEQTLNIQFWLSFINSTKFRSCVRVKVDVLGCPS